METEQVVEQEQLAQPEEAESSVEETVPEVAVEAAPEPHEDDDPEVLDVIKDMGLDPEKKGRISKRVKQLLGRAKSAEDIAREAEQEKQRWRDEVYRRDAITSATALPEVTIDTTDLPIPTRESFDHDEDKYQAAIAERAAVIAYRRERAREKASDEVFKQREAIEKNNQWKQAGRSKYPDFDIALSPPSAGGPSITPPMAHTIQTHEMGHDIAYYLGKNTQESFRISALHPIDQGIEIQRLATKLAQAKPKTETTAPSPTKPMGDRETITKVVDIMSPDIPFAEYEKRRNEQLYGKNWGRK
jgi:hypothetical protein